MKLLRFYKPKKAKLFKRRKPMRITFSIYSNITNHCFLILVFRLFQSVLVYLSLFQTILDYFSLFQSILVYFSLFQSILVYFSLGTDNSVKSQTFAISTSCCQDIGIRSLEVKESVLRKVWLSCKQKQLIVLFDKNLKNYWSTIPYIILIIIIIIFSIYLILSVSRLCILISEKWLTPHPLPLSD